MEIDRRTKVLQTAMDLFIHHGYKKVTLADIAAEVGVSRPTLYQVFPNKEEIFKAIIGNFHKTAIDQIRESRDPNASLDQQLLDAIDIWTIQPYKLIQASPRAEEFQDSNMDFAKEALDEAYAGFEALVLEILNSKKKSRSTVNKDLAHLIAVSVKGYKFQAKNLKELKALVKSLVMLVSAN